jgi:hypothetical protein
MRLMRHGMFWKRVNSDVKLVKDRERTLSRIENWIGAWTGMFDLLGSILFVRVDVVEFQFRDSIQDCDQIQEDDREPIIFSRPRFGIWSNWYDLRQFVFIPWLTVDVSHWYFWSEKCQRMFDWLQKHQQVEQIVFESVRQSPLIWGKVKVIISNKRKSSHGEINHWKTFKSCPVSTCFGRETTIQRKTDRTNYSKPGSSNWKRMNIRPFSGELNHSIWDRAICGSWTRRERRKWIEVNDLSSSFSSSRASAQGDSHQTPCGTRRTNLFTFTNQTMDSSVQRRWLLLWRWARIRKISIEPLGWNSRALGELAVLIRQDASETLRYLCFNDWPNPQEDGSFMVFQGIRSRSGTKFRRGFWKF